MRGIPCMSAFVIKSPIHGNFRESLSKRTSPDLCRVGTSAAIVNRFLVAVFIMYEFAD